MARQQFKNLTFVTAGAGSGKTYSLVDRLSKAMIDGDVLPSEIVAITFTRKAARELQDRLTEALLHSGRSDLAQQTCQGLIGTVDSVCAQLLKDYAFELGLPIGQEVVTDAENKEILRQAVDESADWHTMEHMAALSQKLGLDDWQDMTQAIIATVRTNNLDKQALAASGTDSADSFLAFFPEPESDTSQEQLLEVVEDAIQSLDHGGFLTGINTKKITAIYGETLEESRAKLRNTNCPWPVWMKLSSAKGAKECEDIAKRVQQVASKYDESKEFQSDIRDFIESLIGVATESLSRYADIKAELGLVDYIDLENLLYKALEHEHVVRSLNERIRHIYVDEFQDTSPMQLGIFARLIPLADKVFFVGDMKQSIYAFRDADLELVFQTREDMRNQGAKTEILDSNWRSTPSLVSYVNALFTKVFKDVFEPKEVALRPKRQSLTKVPSILRWTIPGVRQEGFWIAIAQQIGKFVQSGHEITVTDAGQQITRKVRFGDIAVLARTNNNISTLAQELRRQHVPIKLSLGGLMATAEVTLARACLRRLNDRSDTVATAEIVALTTSRDPEAWLEDRLSWLASEQDGRAWQENTHPMVKRLFEIRDVNILRSPVEILAFVLNEVGVREAVTAWGPYQAASDQRQTNLDALLALADQYEGRCERRHEAATLTGFLVWLDRGVEEEINEQPMTLAANDAVQLSTFHGAKGLEWPVVIVIDYERKRPFSFDGVHTLAPSDFNSLDPLRGRRLRFWPNVFGRMSSNIPVRIAIENSDWGQQKTAAEESESKRLMYVALTRAKDAIVIANQRSESEPKYSMLCTLTPQFRDEFMPNGKPLVVLDPTGTETVIETMLSEMTCDEKSTPALPAFEPSWFRPHDFTDFLNASFSPSEAVPIQGAKAGKPLQYADRIQINTDKITELGDALHAVIAMHLLNSNDESNARKMKNILDAHRVPDAVDPTEFLNVLDQFKRKLDEQFKPTRIHCEYPVNALNNKGQVIRGFIDLLLETDEGWVIIDHKATPQPINTLANEVADYSGQLRSYRDAIDEEHGKVASCWLNFPVSGVLVEYENPA